MYVERDCEVKFNIVASTHCFGYRSATRMNTGFCDPSVLYRVEPAPEGCPLDGGGQRAMNAWKGPIGGGGTD